ncbi:UmoD [Xenorhabdus beddingii]|uniref:UmoD n=2 Tax=Xenorhabdus beddingii TaxID=40578 RepID=A0A1Y2SLD6_9GAMM|nr:UmoD [Xenorhabdus beddingii]
MTTRFPQHEYHILTLLDNLKIKREYPALNSSVLKNCIMVDFKQVRVVGYDVTYMIGNNPGKVRMPYNPEEIIPLNKKGKLIIQTRSE